MGTLNGAISSILGAGHGMAERDAAGCPSKSVACPRAWVLNSVAKFVYCAQTLEGRLDEAEIAANFEVPGLSLFWSAFWSFSLAIGACKSFSRLYLSHYPILGRFLSQFEAPTGRGETVGPGALRGIGGEREKGRGGGGGAKHSRRAVPELVPEIVPE